MSDFKYDISELSSLSSHRSSREASFQIRLDIPSGVSQVYVDDNDLNSVCHTVPFPSSYTDRVAKAKTVVTPVMGMRQTGRAFWAIGTETMTSGRRDSIFWSEMQTK